MTFLFQDIIVLVNQVINDKIELGIVLKIIENKAK